MTSHADERMVSASQRNAAQHSRGTDMNARRMTAALLLAGGLLGTAACGTQHSSDAQQVDISTAVSAQRSTTSVGIEGCSSDCGLADEPTATRVAAVLIPSITSVPRACGWAVDDLPDAGWPQVGESSISDALAKACDYRVTGAACEEDEVCAVQVIRDTGDFGGER